MKQQAIPATFMRGGTSKGLMLLAADLPADIAAQDAILLAAMGTPDPYGRQLNGMGGGLSSLSKACIISPSARPDADIDFCFAQIGVRERHVDRRGNCGNMSAAVGPFAVDQGLVPAGSGEATVRIFNSNTGKLIHARFPVEDGSARYDGDLAIPGVAGTGAPIRLDFIEPGGASTGRLLPTGEVMERIDGIAVSLVDAANACLFVRADDIGLAGHEAPEAIEAQTDLMNRLARLRAKASVRMGIAPDEASAMALETIPYLGIVSQAQAAHTLSGELIAPEGVDMTLRFLAGGRVHRAVPLTTALCTAVAARIEGTLVHPLAAQVPTDRPLRLSTPSGVINADARVERRDSRWHASSGSFFRTARPLFEGHVLVPGQAMA
jgi:2-methylaconitate cis-trans-isomerase PrpF